MSEPGGLSDVELAAVAERIQRSDHGSADVDRLRLYVEVQRLRAAARLQPTLVVGTPADCQAKVDQLLAEVRSMEAAFRQIMTIAEREANL